MMDEIRNGFPKYEYMKQMNTEKLEELLRLSGSEEDTPERDEYVDAIISELLRREEEAPTGRLTDVDKAWNDFQTYYNTPDAKPMEVPLPVPNAAKPKKFLWRNCLGIAAALVLLCTLALPPALGYDDFLHMVGEWTDDIFSFTPAGKVRETQSSGSEYQTLEEALDAYGITEFHMPALPEGFELVELVAVPIAEETDKMYITALYQKGHDTVTIMITENEEKNTNYSAFEKNDTSPSICNISGTDYYFFHNNSKETVTWNTSILKCTIHTTLSQEDLQELIESMYERS